MRSNSLEVSRSVRSELAALRIASTSSARTRKTTVFMLAMATCFAAYAAPPSMNDYVQGVVVEASSSQPMIELSLPDPVYQTTTRVDLRDLRVFNANGAPVAHAFCAAPETTEPVVTEQSLPIFELKDIQRADDGRPRIEVQTADGTQVNVRDAEQTAIAGRTHIIDARETEEPLRAITFDWESPDQASQIRVRIEASEDLDRWESLIAATTLLRAGDGAQSLRRERIELPLRTYEYLRVQRADGGPPLILNGVVAERVQPAAEIEPLWFMPNMLVSDEAHVLSFDAARAAPVRFARIRQSVENNSMAVSLQSRADEKSPWRERFSGESYLILTEGERRESAPARFEPTTDRYWRLLTPKDAAALPTLELGYRPLTLRFLAQGPGPYLLAFGSRRAELADPASCDGLLKDVSDEDRQHMIADGYAGEFKTLGGEAALKPLPKKTPTRVIALWAVLIVGVGLLVAMAMSLLKRVRTAEPPAP